MKKVKLITVHDCDAMLPVDRDYEKPLNAALKDIDNTGGKIEDIIYNTDKSGHIRSIAIEYEYIEKI